MGGIDQGNHVQAWHGNRRPLVEIAGMWTILRS